jgi:cytochrome c
MDDLGFNKIAGAVLATGLGMMILMKLPGVVIGGHDEVIAYKVGPTIKEGPVNTAPLPFPQPDWVAAMDATKGAKVFKKCKSCHNVDEGGPNGTGPGLWGVVGTDKASHAGYSFSAVLSGQEGNWSYESLDAFLKKPSAYAKGTKMNFVGLKKAGDRAAVIEYLRLAAPTPLPRPEAASAEVAAEAPTE